MYREKCSTRGSGCGGGGGGSGDDDKDGVIRKDV